MAWDGPKWGREGLFPANPDLADILGRTDLEFESFYFLCFLDSKCLYFQVPRFPEIWPGPGLGWAWAKSLGELVLHDREPPYRPTLTDILSNL